VYKAELAACGGADVTVVCHSLSVPTWLHTVGARGAAVMSTLQPLGLEA